MRAGDRNRRITFLCSTTGYNTYNEPVETWVDAFGVNAAVITTGGKEFYAAQKLNAETEAVFNVRYRGGINTRMRIRWGNRIFEIIPPVNDMDGKRRELLISAKEVT